MNTPTLRTYNLWVACYAALQGVDIVDVVPTEDEMNFAFLLDDTEGQAGKALTDYLAGNPSVNLRALIRVRSALVRRVNTARAKLARRAVA
jgi:hypothetical protein